MVKKISFIIFLFFLVNANALSIKLNSTKENKANIFILHITNQEPFNCKKKILNINQNEYICTVKGKNEVKILPKKTKSMDLYITNQKNFTLLTIKPKMKLKIFKLNIPLFQKKSLIPTT